MITLPSPRTAPLTGDPTLRWGVLAPGRIARSWAGTVLANTDQPIVAVGSSSRERAEAFARDFGIERAYGSYEALVADPSVDAVYVSGLNEVHRPHALLAIAAGKHVLVEKPLGSTAAEAREIAAAARAAGVFAMEAMWTRFLPQTEVLLELVAEGAFGDLGLVEADFAPRLDPVASSRVYTGGVHGGALLDLGVYPLSFVRFLLGASEAFTVSGTLLDSGSDGTTVIVQDYASGARSVTSTSAELGFSARATILGSKASAHFPRNFYMPGRFLFTDGDDAAEYVDPNGWTDHTGLCYQVAAFAADVAEGLAESPKRPLDESIAVLELIDEARRRIGAPTV